MFLENARQGKNDWWRWLVTLLLVALCTVLGQLPLYFAAKASGEMLQQPESEWNAKVESLDFAGLGLDPNVGLALVLLSFACGLGALLTGVYGLHGRPYRSLITPFARVNWRKFFFGFGLWMGLSVGSEIIFYLLNPAAYTFQFEPGPFLGLLVVALLLLPLQTSFEELLFRGYLLQGLGLFIPWRWLPLLITSVAFGLLHFMNPEVQAFGAELAMSYYIGVGLFLGFVTLMDDGLELALGIHAATNIFGALFVTFDASALQTAALFHTSEVAMPMMLAALVLAAIVFTFVVSKKYNWHDWSRWYRRSDTQPIADTNVSFPLDH